MTYPQNFKNILNFKPKEYNLKTFTCQCNTNWIIKKVGNTKRIKLICSGKKTSEICKEKMKISFVSWNLKARLPFTIYRWSGKRSKSCLYYATDLYEFEVRTECPEVRIELGRCYYKSWDGKQRHESNLYNFIMHVHTLDVMK